MKRRFLYPLLAALCLSMAGCAADSQAMEPSPSANPTSSPSAAPMQTTEPMSTDPNPMTSPGDLPGTLMDGAADAASAGVTSAEDARRFIDLAEDEIDKLSEVDDAQVIIIGNEAVVAIEPDDQYQGGIDDRIRDMIRERVKSVVSGVTRVAVTDDPAIYETLERLGDSMDGAVDLDALKQEVQDIISRIEA